MSWKWLLKSIFCSFVALYKLTATFLLLHCVYFCVMHPSIVYVPVLIYFMFGVALTGRIQHGIWMRTRANVSLRNCIETLIVMIQIYNPHICVRYVCVFSAFGQVMKSNIFFYLKLYLYQQGWWGYDIRESTWYSWKEHRRNSSADLDDDDDFT